MAWSLTASRSAAGANGATTGSGFSSVGASLSLIGICSYSAVADATVSDNAGNTYTPLTKYTTASFQYVRWFYCLNPTSNASATATASSTSGFTSIVYAVYSGGAIVSGFDVENGAINNGSTTTISPGSITPTQNNDLIVALLGFNGSTASPTIGASLTVRQFINFSAGTNFGIAFADFVQTSAAAINPAWSYSASPQIANSIASFKIAPVGGAVQVTLTLLGCGA